MYLSGLGIGWVQLDLLSLCRWQSSFTLAIGAMAHLHVDIFAVLPFSGFAPVSI